MYIQPASERKIINTHFHLINYDFIPDSYFKIRSPIKESLLRKPIAAWLLKIIMSLIPGEKYDNFHDLVAIMRRDIFSVMSAYFLEMSFAGIVMATPLLLDFEYGSLNMKAEHPYEYQIMQISQISTLYPGVLMPFLMVDPKRPGVLNLAIETLEEKGFLGIKLYPPLGHHPDPQSFLNNKEMNTVLDKLYQYCEKNSVPITAHCSKGGSYSADLVHCKHLILKFADPDSWQYVLAKYPLLNINFAHFGGNILDTKRRHSWQRKIIKYMKMYPNVYADLSYHEQALEEKTKRQYFAMLKEFLNDDIIKTRLLFGTDWPTTLHTWQEPYYVQPFLENLEKEEQELIFFKNPMKFLFPNNIMPDRIIKFFAENGIGYDSFPDFLTEYLDKD